MNKYDSLYSYRPWTLVAWKRKELILTKENGHPRPRVVIFLGVRFFLGTWNET